MGRCVVPQRLRQWNENRSDNAVRLFPKQNLKRDGVVVEDIDLSVEY